MMVEKSGEDSRMRQSSSGGRFAKEAIAVILAGETVGVVDRIYVWFI